jgi:hypothetical protein
LPADSATVLAGKYILDSIRNLVILLWRGKLRRNGLMLKNSCGHQFENTLERGTALQKSPFILTIYCAPCGFKSNHLNCEQWTDIY